MRNTLLPDLLGEWTEDDARRVLDEWRRSGQSIAAFARAPHERAAAVLVAEAAAGAELGGSADGVAGACEDRRAVGGNGARGPDASGVAIEITGASPSWVAAIVTELERSS
jgi:hypothetical protein